MYYPKRLPREAALAEKHIFPEPTFNPLSSIPTSFARLLTVTSLQY